MTKKMRWSGILACFTIFSCINIPPSLPTGLNVSRDQSIAIHLEWDDLENTSGYRIYRADYDFYKEIETLNWEVIGTSEKSEYDDIDVLSDSEYWYKVCGYNSTGDGETCEAILGNTTEISAKNAFEAIALYTDGYFYEVNNLSNITETIIRIIRDHAVSQSDIVFLIDNTGSMVEDIFEIKHSIDEITSSMPSGTRIAMAAFKDANVSPDTWYTSFNLSNDYKKAFPFLEGLNISGGGDLPESLFDGIFKTVMIMDWTLNNRMMIIVGDAPPHESYLSSYSFADVIHCCTKDDIPVKIYPMLINTWW